MSWGWIHKTEHGGPARPRRKKGYWAEYCERAKEGSRKKRRRADRRAAEEGFYSDVS